jgi:hypothetical protein
VVAPIELLVLRHPLLDAEYVVSEPQAGRHLALVANATDLIADHRHPSTYRRMSRCRALALSYGPAWT